MAPIFKRANIPIVTYITPNFWIWNDIKSAKKICAYSQKIITIFEKEYQFYKSLKKEVYYFGHPLAVSLKPLERKNPLSKKVITLFPGSRTQEINYLLPIMLEATEKVANETDNIEFILCPASEKFKSQIDLIFKQFPNHPATIWTEPKLDLFKKTSLLISATGTASLEAILYKLPLIIIGAISPLTYFWATKILRISLPFAGLPNIIANDTIVPELIQEKLSVSSLFKEIKSSLEDDNLQRATENYLTVKNALTHSEKPIEETVKIMMKDLYV